ncbi:MAG: Na(+)-translocating NADH-quinone reductase subunit C [Moraxella sp.]|nr:Na(+)-translocating NADH-quinone reductase subunit C [Moraxella sp.]
MSAPKNSNITTLAVALVLCLVCSVMVSAVAVGLKPKQVENAKLDQSKNILIAAGLATEDTTNSEVAQLSADFKPQIIQLKEGRFATAEELAEAGITDVATYNADAAAKRAGLGNELSEDPARVGHTPVYAKVYIKDAADGKPELVVLPVKGYGLWGTIYGFLVLENDMNTIKGVSFYQHKETAGLGSRITEPQWRGLWEGRPMYDDKGEIIFGVVKNGSHKPNPNYIDGISGATLTGRGVNNFIQFWLGEQGYKTFLNNLKSGQAGTPAQGKGA